MPINYYPPVLKLLPPDSVVVIGGETAGTILEVDSVEYTPYSMTITLAEPI